MTPYIALIRKGSETDFGVDFPDFPGCITAGRSLDEAMTMAREALAFHIKGMTEDGTPIPAPRSLTDIMADPANADGVAVLVESPTPRPVIERVNITLEKQLLQAIDDRAAAEGMTRSGFIAAAARRLLGAELPSAGLGKPVRRHRVVPLREPIPADARDPRTTKVADDPNPPRRGGFVRHDPRGRIVGTERVGQAGSHAPPPRKLKFRPK